MKNITQTILLGLALCCLMVSNSFGQITEWQELKVRQTLTQYCELMTRFIGQEDAQAAEELKKLFTDDKVMVYNDFNRKDPYTELRFYLRDVEKKRTKDLQLIFPIPVSVVKITPLNIMIKPDDKFIEAILLQQMKVKNYTTKTYEVKVLIDINSGKIVNTFNDEILAVNEALLSQEALLSIAIKMLINKEYDKGLQRLLRLAKKGHKYSMYILGEVYLKHYDDVEQAVIWFRKSIDKGEPASMYSLANLYENLYNGMYENKGLEKNPIKALELYRKAVEKNYASAYYALGLIYQIGELVPKNDSIAFNIYEDGLKYSSDKSDKSVQYCKYSLANMYAKGNYVKKNMQKAFQLSLECAEGGMPECMHNVAISYIQGEGTEINKSEGERWLLEAAQKGDADNQCVLGEYYLTQRTYENIYYFNEGVKWLKKAVIGGSTKADSILRSFILNTKAQPDSVDIDIILIEMGKKYFSIEQYEKKAFEYFEKGQYQHTIKIMEVALEKGSEKKGAYMLLMFSYLYLGDFLNLDYYSGELIKIVDVENLDVKKLDNLYKENIYLKLIALAFRSMSSTKIDKQMELGLAKPHFEKILKLSEDIAKSEDLFKFLSNKFIIGNPDKSKAEKSINSILKGADAHKYLAQYYEKNKNTKKAIFHYEKLLEITPEDQEAKQALETLKAEKK